MAWQSETTRDTGCICNYFHPFALFILFVALENSSKTVSSFRTKSASWLVNFVWGVIKNIMLYVTAHYIFCIWLLLTNKLLVWHWTLELRILDWVLEFESTLYINGFLLYWSRVCTFTRYYVYWNIISGVKKTFDLSTYLVDRCSRSRPSSPSAAAAPAPASPAPTSSSSSPAVPQAPALAAPSSAAYTNHTHK